MINNIIEFFEPNKPRETIQFFNPCTLIQHISLPGEYWLYVNDKAVPGIIPNRYIVSSHGRVYDTERQMFPNTHISGGGQKKYLSTSFVTVNSRSVSKLIHRVVMMTFNYFEGCEQYEVDHVDGNPSNNHIINLEWVTHFENIRRSHEKGLVAYGEDKVESIYTNVQIGEICKGLSEGKPYRECAQMAGLEYTDNMFKLISGIKRRIVWTIVSKDYDFPEERSTQMFTNDQAHELCRQLEKGKSCQEAYETLGMDMPYSKVKTTVEKIRLGTRYGKISMQYNIDRTPFKYRNTEK